MYYDIITDEITAVHALPYRQKYNSGLLLESTRVTTRAADTGYKLMKYKKCSIPNLFLLPILSNFNQKPMM